MQGTGSSAGIKAAIEGTADLGMSSRNLKEAELAELTPVIIAMDGIAVVVNPKPREVAHQEQVSQVFKGGSSTERSRRRGRPHRTDLPRSRKRHRTPLKN